MKHLFKAVPISIVLIATSLGGYIACRTTPLATPKENVIRRDPKFDFNSQFGLVEFGPAEEKTACLAINNSGLTENSRITVIFDESRIGTAVVERKLTKTCSFENRMLGATPQFNHFYSIKFLKIAFGGFDVGVAVVDPLGPVQQEGRDFSVQLDTIEKLESIERCPTREGFKWIVWSDKKFQGKCVWEASYYLGDELYIDWSKDTEGGCDCSTPRPIKTATPERNLDQNLLEMYEAFLAKLDAADFTSIPIAVKKYEALFGKQSIQVRDMAFGLFDSYHDKVESNISELTDLTISGTKYRKLINKLKQCGFRTYSSEGDEYLAADGDYIAKNFYPYLSKTMKEYLKQLNREWKEGFVEDGGLLIGPEAFVDRVIWWENFVKDNDGFTMIIPAKQRRDFYLGVIMYGTDNHRVLWEEKSSELDDYYKVAYAYLQKVFPNSRANKVISPFFMALLEKNWVKAQWLRWSIR